MADFTLSFLDQVSGPAAKAAIASQRLKSGLDALKAGAKSASALNKVATAAKQLKTALEAPAKAAAKAAAAQQKAAAKSEAAAVKEAAAAAREAAKVVAAKNKIAVAAKKAAEAQIKAANKAAEAQAKAAEEANAAQQKMNKGMTLSTAKGTIMGRAVVGAFKAIKSAAIGAVKAVAGMSFALGKAIVESARFSARSKTAFKILAGGAKQGEALFSELKDVILDLGLDLEGTAKGATKLLSVGLKPKQVVELVKLTADMKAFGATSDEVTRVLRALGKVVSTGKLQGDELESLVEAGLPAQAVFKELSKQLGVSVAEVQKLKTAGKITSEQFLKATKAAILNTAGTKNAGDAAREAAKNFDGLINKIKSRVQLTVLKLAEKLLPKLSKLADTFLGKLEGLFEGPEGEARLAKLGDSFEKLIDIVSEVDVAVIFDKLISQITEFNNNLSDLVGLGTSVKNVLKGMQKGAENLGTFLHDTLIQPIKDIAATDPAQAIGKFFSGFKDAIVENIKFIFGIGESAASGSQAVGASLGSGMIEGFGSSLSAGISGIGSSILASATSIGTSIIDGIVTGITSGISSVINAAINVATSAINAAKSALSSSSPSKVFMGIGLDTSEGMAMGLDQGAPMVAASAAGMVPQPATGGGGGNSSSVSMGGANISVDGSEDPAATAAAVKEIFVSQLAGAFEQLSMELAG